ncbi:hypothetical protein CYMTET_33776, partial [Cymbomonas tetramitiformis]
VDKQSAQALQQVVSDAEKVPHVGRADQSTALACMGLIAQIQLLPDPPEIAELEGVLALLQPEVKAAAVQTDLCWAADVTLEDPAHAVVQVPPVLLPPAASLQYSDGAKAEEQTDQGEAVTTRPMTPQTQTDGTISGHMGTGRPTAPEVPLNGGDGSVKDELVVASRAQPADPAGMDSSRGSADAGTLDGIPPPDAVAGAVEEANAGCAGSMPAQAENASSDPSGRGGAPPSQREYDETVKWMQEVCASGPEGALVLSSEALVAPTTILVGLSCAWPERTE